MALASSRIYLDYNAGAPLRGAARQAMVDALAVVGNASSVHGEGRAARAKIEKARRQVAALVGAEPSRVIFASGGTEANVTTLSPRFKVGGGELVMDWLLVGATEHPSVLSGGRFPTDRVATISVDGDGIIDLAALEALLAERAGQRVLVSVMLANNETGAIQPVAKVVALARKAGALVHCDAVQAAGRIPVDMAALGVDVLTLSAHKIGGPQGAGAIVLGGDLVSPAPLLVGGGQEKYARAGTENVAAIAGFGASAESSLGETASATKWTMWRDRLATDLCAAGPGITVLSARAERLPQTVAVSVDGALAETLLIALDLEGVAVSAGAACSSGKVGVSHVLTAMGVPMSRAKGTLRVSFGWETTEVDLHRFTGVWRRVIERVLSGTTRAA